MYNADDIEALRAEAATLDGFIVPATRGPSLALELPGQARPGTGAGTAALMELSASRRLSTPSLSKTRCF